MSGKVREIIPGIVTGLDEVTKIRAVNICASGHEGSTKDRLGRNQRSFSHHNFLTREYFAVSHPWLDTTGILIPRKPTQNQGMGWVGRDISHKARSKPRPT